MNNLLVKTTLAIGSPAFVYKKAIPIKYTCEGDNINPPITIENIPDEIKSLALIVDDPDAPNGTFDHWIMWDIPPTKMIAENTAPGIEGLNGFGKIKYQGPCPPSGTHRYLFKVYALDTLLHVKEGADKHTVEKAMQGHILAEGLHIGTYKKHNKNI